MESQTCVSCGKHAPDTETNYTLISAQFGWRLTRFKGPDGAIVLEWRCPTCWREYKRARTTPGATQASGAGPSVPSPASHSSWPPPPGGPRAGSSSPDAAGSGSPPAASGVPATEVPASGPPRTTRRTSR